MPAADTSHAYHISPEEAAIDWLTNAGHLTEQDLDHGRDLAENTSRSVLITLNKIGILTDDLLANVIHRITGLPLHEGELPASTSETPKLNPDFMRDTQCLLMDDKGPLFVVDPLDDRLMRAAEFALGFMPDLKVIKAGDWHRAFQDRFPGEDALESAGDIGETDFATELADQNRDAPIVRQVTSWLAEAADQSASDIHFDARRNAFAVQYRIDGRLRPISTQAKSIGPSVIARIKVIADLDLGERNKPQDGRATIVVRGRRLDVRVSIIPTIDGESAVIRLLDRPDGLLSLSQLGFDAAMQAQLQAITNQRHGMFIVAGPTGSGKTTTLYACIEQLKGRGLKILSVEDPVEYHFEHVNQVQISEKAGRDFAGALRAFLRHDPDVILVGEIRDNETAQVAVQASLSGHLVLATIHAIDTARVKTRLVDMGVEPFKLEACLLGSMAQRLVRLLCDECKIQTVLTDTQSQLFEAHHVSAPAHIYTSTGCSSCYDQGFLGRAVIADLQSSSTEQNTGGLMRRALICVAEGRTSFSEIIGFTDR